MSLSYQAGREGERLAFCKKQKALAPLYKISLVQPRAKPTPPRSVKNQEAVVAN